MILIIAEHRDGKLNRATLETIAAAQQAGGSSAAGSGLKVALLGAGIDSIAAEIAAAAIEEVIVVDDAALKDYTADGFVIAIEQLIAAESPERVFLPHT